MPNHSSFGGGALVGIFNNFKQLVIDGQMMTERKDSNAFTSYSPRRVRSFVRRAGRVTRAQNRALGELWPVYGLATSAARDLDSVLPRRAPRFLEIGFGMGDALAAMAAAQPCNDFLGIDVHEAGIGRLLLMLHENALTNVRVLRGDAVELLANHLRADSLDGIMVFFPDPWPKKRHHKRRLVQPAFLKLCARALRAGGVIHLATDWAPYAEAMMEHLEAAPEFQNLHGHACFADSPDPRPVTKFESRGQRLGHAIFDLRFERRD